MSSIAHILGQTLFAIVGGVGGIGRRDLGHADQRPMSDIKMDASASRRASSRHTHSG